MCSLNIEAMPENKVIVKSLIFDKCMQSLKMRQLYSPQQFGSSFPCSWFRRHASRASNYSHVCDPVKCKFENNFKLIQPQRRGVPYLYHDRLSDQLDMMRKEGAMEVGVKVFDCTLNLVITEKSQRSLQGRTA